MAGEVRMPADEEPAPLGSAVQLAAWQKLQSKWLPVAFDPDSSPAAA